MALTHNLGFPRIGRQRELKFALERYWRGEIDATQLETTARTLRDAHWRWQAQAGLDRVPVGDFAHYDHVLETQLLFGQVPARFGATDAASLDTLFALARGTAAQPAQEMTKWFDTNYHYLVPEFGPETRFAIASERLFRQVAEAQLLGVKAKPVLLGPISFLWLGKSKVEGFDRLSLLPTLVEAYRAVLDRLAGLGVDWVQIDEPVLVLDLPEAWLTAFDAAHRVLAGASVKRLLATYFGDVSGHLDRLAALPFDGVHIDAVRAPTQLDTFAARWPQDRVLSVGIVDGRNIWRTDLSRALQRLQPLAARGAQLWLAPSCSLLHVPVDLSQEQKLDGELLGWLAFARQKLEEVALLARGLNEGVAAIAPELAASDAAASSRRSSCRIHRADVASRVTALTEADASRHNAFPQRIAQQQALLQLPPLPTTTIGSFPQTPDIRAARAAFKKGELPQAGYEAAMRAAIRLSVQKQEELGIDVLVHGEAERNDMVEYFGEQLDGYTFTQHGWVQSYGSRCVKPPVIYGDVCRPLPMTVVWSKFAQELTRKPMKGMLTGPVTMLQWSFVRDDLPRETVTLQIALALRDEVRDLEAAGIRVIQIDEPAFREGLPLRRADWESYLEWAARAFRVCSSGVEDATQIHTHMCYSEFHDILLAIAAMDADVITIETSRSDMELLEAFAAQGGKAAYPNDIGPGVYDIHSPRVPSAEEMSRLIDKALTVVPAERLWINPDCGLKTRGWPETEAALRNMVEATRQARAALAQV